MKKVTLLATMSAAPIRNTYNAINVFIKTAAAVINHLGKILHFVERIGRIGNYIESFFARIASFFSIFTTAFARLNLIWTNISHLLGSFKLILKPLNFLHKTTNFLFGIFSSGCGNMMEGLHKTKHAYRSTASYFQGCFDPIKAQVEYLMNLWTNISQYLPTYLGYLLQVLIVPLLTLVLIFMRTIIFPFTLLHSAFRRLYHEETDNTRREHFKVE